MSVGEENYANVFLRIQLWEKLAGSHSLFLFASIVTREASKAPAESRLTV